MDRLIIQGRNRLTGSVSISGAKNAALPILCASILTENQLRLTNVPQLRDVITTQKLLQELGIRVMTDNVHEYEITARDLTSCTAPYDLVKTMRASILVLGPLLARLGEAKVSLPGGCAIGLRPVDQHIKGLQALGANITLEHGYIHAKAERLKGAHIKMDMITVTGTENIMMAATLAKGITIIENAAREPEVVDLAYCLCAMGAQIEGIGTDVLSITGVDRLHGAAWNILPDRIESGTFAVAAALTQGDITLTETNPNLLLAVLDKLRATGAETSLGDDWIRIKSSARPHSVSIRTSAHPGFPTDMQAQFMTLNSVAQGNATMVETIFENRLMHVQELRRMGAQIETEGNTASITGVSCLTGAAVMATDLRASASLVLAGLTAEGETIIDRVYHLDRGYEHIERKLSGLGALIERTQ